MSCFGAIPVVAERSEIGLVRSVKQIKTNLFGGENTMRLGQFNILGTLIVALGLVGAQAYGQRGNEKGREGRSHTEIRRAFERAVQEGKIKDLRDQAARNMLYGKEGSEGVKAQDVETFVERAKQERAAQGQRNTENGPEISRQELTAKVRQLADKEAQTDMTTVLDLVDTLNGLALVRGEKDPSFTREAVNSFVDGNGKNEIAQLKRVLLEAESISLAEINRGGSRTVREIVEEVIRRNFPEKAEEIIQKCLV